MTNKYKFLYIPSNLSPEGSGSTFQTDLLAYMLSIHEGSDYVRIRRALDYRHEPSFISEKSISENWDRMMGFMGEAINFDEIELFKLRHSNCQLINSNELFKRIDRLNDTSWSLLVNKLRVSFYQNTEIYKSDDYSKNIRVALHLRNLSPGDTSLNMDSLSWQLFGYDYGFPNQNNEFYSKLYAGLILKKFKNYKKNDCITIEIYPTGDHNDFAKLIAYLKEMGFNHVLLHLNRPSYVDFLSLITADALIMAQSSFSYIAALLSYSPKFIRNSFRHRLPPDTFIFRDYVALDYPIHFKMYSLISDIVGVLREFKNKIV